MPWFLIVSGVIMFLVGVVLKYHQLKTGQVKSEPEGEEQDLLGEADLIKHRDKLQEINHDLDRLINQINDRDKIIKELLEEKIPVKENFREIFKDNYRQNKALPIASKYAQVIALSRQGLTCQDIAEKLDFGVRETKLILKFYQKEEDSVV